MRGDVPITGSTNSTYTLTQADVGNTVAVAVSFIDGLGNKETLATGISDYGHNNVSIINNENEICDKILSIAEPNDVVIFLGAGSITKWSDTIVFQLNNSGLKNEKIF